MGWWGQGPENQDAVLGSLRRGLITSVNDTGPQQLVNLQGLASELPINVLRIQPHGFSSNPPANSEGVFLALGGRSDRLVFIGGERPPNRPTNTPTGAAVLYDQNGNVIFAKMANGIAIDASTGQVYVKPGSGQNVYLGGTGSDGGYALVATVSGPSINVLARIS